MSDNHESNDIKGRSDTKSDRPIFDLNYKEYTAYELEKAVRTIADNDENYRESKRKQDRRDRLEKSLSWQQKIVMFFLLYVVVMLMLMGIVASFILFVGGDERQMELSKDVIKLIVESGIAALIGFCAIKIFEK